MSSEVELATASREELLALIAEQQRTIALQEAVIGRLQERIAGLEARLAGRSSGGPPGNKPTQAKAGPEKKARKRRPKGFARCRLTPTERVEHAVETCPDCGTRLFGGWVQRTREVIELPVEPVREIEHVDEARLTLRLLARPRPQPLPGLPPTPDFPSTLNSYLDITRPGTEPAVRLIGDVRLPQSFAFLMDR